MQLSLLLTILLVIVAIATTLTSAGNSHRCNTPDCTDIIGEGLVKENLGTAQHFTENHHEKMEADHRRNRIELAERGEIDFKDL